MALGYPQEHVNVYACKCGNEIEHHEYFHDEYEHGDGGELDITCTCGAYYKRVRNVLNSGGRFVRSLAKQVEPYLGDGRVIITMRPL